ncbi:MAG: RluA family pseudouridine synthase [Bacillota bacterium]|nr:RluA family pseudouridine synthase [Bacillota bacterium]MDP4170107.1 RluA family pseudouridine synthase [Bacillota bacterium]
MLRFKKMGKWIEFTIQDNWSGITVDSIFREKWKAPKKFIHTFRTEKKVTVDGEPVNWDAPLATGSKVQVRLFDEETSDLKPAFLDVPVLYEDDHLIVFNKPPFMRVHPNSIEDVGTLAQAAAFHVQAQGELTCVRHIHRLDKDTTGAILFSKHSLVGALLDQMLEKREIKRTYLAIIDGIFPQKKGIFTDPIGRDRHHPTKRRVSSTGQKAITHFKTIKIDQKKRLTMVKCWLDTGRTHQIRVHFSHAGFPLAGDAVYGGRPVFKRQALHAVKLEFTHPLTGEFIVCHAPFTDNPVIFKDIDIYSI